jgi:hypothetical protein
MFSLKKCVEACSALPRGSGNYAMGTAFPAVPTVALLLCYAHQQSFEKHKAGGDES